MFRSPLRASSGYTTGMLVKCTQIVELRKEKHLMLQWLLVHCGIVHIRLRHYYGTYYCNTFRLSCVAILRVYTQGSCIVTNMQLSDINNNFYSKTNQMHNISNLFYFGTTLYMFRTVSPSIIRSLRLYIQHHTIQVLWLLASKQPQNLYDLYLMLYV